jgi:hypothetical protein
MAGEESLGMDLNHQDYTYETPEVLDILWKSGDRLRYQELKNMELRGQIEILEEETIDSPRTVDKEGNETPAEHMKIVYFMTISKTLIEEDLDTSI